MPSSHKLSPVWAFFVGVSVALATAEPAASQSVSDRPNVFFDCDGRNCNSQYYRTEIDWVNWVNDQAVSDVHVIMASAATGAGGREYQIDFIGRASQDDYVDQMRFQTLPTDTDREQLDGITYALGVGLARFGTFAGFGEIVTFQAPNPESSGGRARRVVSRQEVVDRWNLWVFRITGSGEIQGEESERTETGRGSFNASRVTPTWKMRFNGNFTFEQRRFDLSDGEFKNTRTDWGFNPLVAYALAEHWSVGVQGQAARVTRFNQGLRVEVTPALEYSFFPYEEATRRSLTAFYKIGPAYRDYIEPTIYQQTDEVRWEQSMSVQFSQRQTWGEAGLSLTGSHFLHDFDRSNLSLRGNIDFRITRGFSLNARGDVAWVDDQIYLPIEDATDAEALLELRQRATDFQYGVTIGFSVQFGSIFNNVVNNRFNGAGRGGGRGFF